MSDVDAGIGAVGRGEAKAMATKQKASRATYYAPINVSPHLPPPGAGWGIFLVWNGRLAPGVGILNR